MNRHHPYGGGAYEGGHRRGGVPGGPGPDRSFNHRGGAPRGRGFGRGRGSFHGGHDNGPSTSYDQNQHQANVSPYNNYDTGTQDHFYQNGHGNYTGATPQTQYTVQSTSDGYTQGYGSFEEVSDANYDDGAVGRTRRIVRRERDDKVHDSIIEERIQRERPCRTLFIRNIKYETNSDDVRRSFEEHGEIKTFFDLIATRGMVFVTYFDLRAAERARERLQGSEISGRPIDVHYSLPRDDQKQGGSDREKNQQYQGCLIVTLKDSRQPIDDNEVRRKFQQFGDVKSVMPVGDRTDQRYVEYYDMRNCDEAFDRLRHQGLQDGAMDIIYAWEESEITGPATQRRESRYDGGRDWDDRSSRSRGRARGRGRGRGYDDGWDRRDDFRDRERRGFDDDPRGGRGGRGYSGDRGYGGDRYDRPPYPPAGGNFSEPTSTATPYAQPSPGLASSQTQEDRLEQARRVQQLLAALKQPQNGSVPPPVPTQPAHGSVPPPTLAMPPIAQQPPTATQYYPPPPVQQPAHPYPTMSSQNTSPYGQMPPQTQTPQPGQAPPGMGTLPPNILALLQQSSTQQAPLAPQPSSAPQYGMPPPPQMMSPPPMSSLPPGAPQPGGPGYQQLMAFLASQKRG